MANKIQNDKVYITRQIEPELNKLFQQYPIITIVGPRQAGKSTVVQHVFNKKPYVNLEELDVRSLAENDPRGFLAQYPEGAILDEIQNVPTLLSYLQVTVDAKQQNGLFILTGSHQLDLHEAISQSLAGRTAIFELLPLSIAELAKANIDIELDQYLFNGFLPRIYKEKLNPTQAYRDYVRTYLERDVRKIVNVKDLTQFQKFIKLCAARVGQVLNLNNLCNEVGISNHTAESWLSILQASYLVIKLMPYYENFGKRVIKSPKIYFTDIGLVAYLLDINNLDQIRRDPLRGQLIENMIVIELFKTKLNRNKQPNYYFYRDNNMREIDVIYKTGNQLIPIEIKASQTFNQQFLKGLKYFKDLVTTRVPTGYIIYAGTHEQQLDEFKLINYKKIDKYFC
jgi:predicted AAA+ superfamily ATPase